MKFKRDQLQTLKKRVAEKRKFIQVIIGPRQVGKTTLVNQLLEEIKIPNYYVSTDATLNTNNVWIEQQWQTARLLHEQSKKQEFLFIIDEIQKIQNWSEEIKKLWDEDTRKKVNIKLIILGSSSLLIQKGLTESLAGRFELIRLGHWSYTEMNKAFGWNSNQFIWFGGYPGSAELINDEYRWKNYINESLIETSISKDILLMTRVDKPALMKQLFSLGCSYSGQILSFNKILGQLHDAGNTTTLSHYLNLLNNAGMLAGLEKFTSRKVRIKSSSPKFQVHNTAFLSSLMEEGFKEILKKPEKWGRVVESSIGAHLLNSSIMKDIKLFYWRQGNDEVDFVIERKGRIIAIEVKSQSLNNIPSFNIFKQKYKPHKILLIGESGLRIEEFLKINPVDLY